MGFFSKLFGGAKPEETASGPAQTLRRFIDEKLPENYVNSKQYAVSITKKGETYVARIVLDMKADGSDYAGFGLENFEELADWESDYLYSKFLKESPVPARYVMEMVFDKKNRITVEKG